jgi:hypothetical protein
MCIATRWRRHWHIAARMECDCAYYWSGNDHCYHIVAVYHCIGIINIFGMMSKLAPVRKRGRSTTRDKALERDRDLGYVNPARWRKQDIAHPLIDCKITAKDDNKCLSG